MEEKTCPDVLRFLAVLIGPALDSCAGVFL